MGRLEVACENCGKNVILREDCVRRPVFCTLGCMNIFNKKKR